MGRSLRRLPTVRSCIFVFWIEESYHNSSTSEQSKEIINRINALQICHIVLYKKASRCIRYLKRARRYERIMIIMVTNEITALHVNEFNRYPQVQSIFIISPTSSINDDVAREISRRINVFNNYETMFMKFQQLMSNDQSSSTNITLKTFHPNGRSLRDVRQDLGPFVWSHSYTGNSSWNNRFVMTGIHLRLSLYSF